MNSCYTFNNIGKLFLTLCLTAALLTLSGCSGSVFSEYREIATLQPVQTLGFDTDKTGFKATVSTGKGLEDQPTALLSVKGATLSECFERIQDLSGKNELYFDQTRFLLLGEDAAVSGLAPYLDYMEREGVPRLDNSLFVVKGGSAQDLITGSGDKGYEITECLATIERDVDRRGEGAAFNCRELLRSLGEFGSALICAVEIKKTDNAVFSESGEVTAVPAGFAIIKGLKCAGYIKPEDCSLGANILLNKGGSASVTLPLDEGRASLRLVDSSTKYEAKWREGRLLSLTARVSVSAELTAFTSRLGVPEPGELALLKQTLKNETKSRCETVLMSCRKLESDFLGLSLQLRRAQPGEFAALKTDFPTALGEAELTVEVDAEIVQTYVPEVGGDGRAA